MRWWNADLVVHYRQRMLCLKRRPARQYRHHDAAQCIQITALGGWIPLNLLGRKIRSAPNDGIGDRQPRCSRLRQMCDPEVDDLQHAASIKDQIRRLNIPMHHACTMGAR
jgi:hypothetical protein